jgi:hypothetical protein
MLPLLLLLLLLLSGTPSTAATSLLAIQVHVLLFLLSTASQGKQLDRRRAAARGWWLAVRSGCHTCTVLFDHLAATAAARLAAADPEARGRKATDACRRAERERSRASAEALAVCYRRSIAVALAIPLGSLQSNHASSFYYHCFCYYRFWPCSSTRQQYRRRTIIYSEECGVNAGHELGTPVFSNCVSLPRFATLTLHGV